MAEHQYEWEAELSTGEIITKSPEDGDFSKVVRLSFVPSVPVLPRHDIIGVPVLRRFIRNFVKSRINAREDLPGLVFWEDGSVTQRTSEDLRERIKAGDYIGKGVAGEDWYMVRSVAPDAVILLKAYAGKSKPRGMFARKIDRSFTQASEQSLHCAELTNGTKVWINDATGSVLIAPKEKDIYL